MQPNYTGYRKDFHMGPLLNYCLLYDMQAQSTDTHLALGPLKLCLPRSRRDASFFPLTKMHLHFIQRFV